MTQAHYKQENDMTFKFDLGSKLRCTVTGFVGIATARSEYLNGCINYCLKPPVDEDGKDVKAYWVDEPQLEAIEKSTQKVAEETVGGTRSDYPPESPLTTS